MSEVKDYDFYLAGPMNGLPEKNAPLFNEAAVILRDAGNKVFNPADHYLLMGMEAPRAGYFRLDYPALLASKAITLLPGWEGGEGAWSEYLMAKNLGLMITAYDPDTKTVMEMDTLPSLNFGKLQREVREWADKNFPGRHIERPILGLCEEVGELAEAYLWKGCELTDEVDVLLAAIASLGHVAHAHLKSAQGIRGDKETHKIAALQWGVKVVHAVIAYLMATGHNLPLVAGLMESVSLFEVEELDEKERLRRMKDAIGDITVYASHECCHLNASYQDVIETTWGRVKRRDWTKNKQNGGDADV